MLIVAWKTLKDGVRGTNFNPTHDFQGEELDVDLISYGQWFTTSYLCNETSIKEKKRGGLKRFQVGEHCRFEESGVLWEGMETSALSPYLAKCISSIWLPEWYLLLINQWPRKYNASLSHSSKLMDFKTGMSLELQLVGQKCRWQPELATGLQNGGGRDGGVKVGVSSLIILSLVDGNWLVKHMFLLFPQLPLAIPCHLLKLL